MFGDLEKNSKQFIESTIGSECEVKGGKRVPKGEQFSDKITLYPYLRVKDLKNGTVSDEDIQYLYEETYEKIKRYIINKEDVYLTNVGSIGKSGIIPSKYNGANLTENAVKLVIKNNNINNIFLSKYIESSYGQKCINKRTMTVGVPKLAIFRIEEIPLLIPPIELQNQFADFVTQVDKLKFNNAQVN
jgi:type I restriction enzyme S subunit